MSTAETIAPPPPKALFTSEETGGPPRHSLQRRFWAMSSGFWRGKTARIAWILTLAIVALILANIAIQYGINRWNRYFFDAIEAKDSSRMSFAIMLFAALAVSAVVGMVAQVFCRLALQAQWRRWLTGSLAIQWLEHRRFYQMSIAVPDLDSPEFRMTDDVRIATEPIVDFGIGLSNAILMAAVFVGVLWSAGGAITVWGMTIPGYFVIAAALYGVLSSGIMVVLGRPLIRYTERKNAAEAQVRFELVRVRENAESIALIGGEEGEERQIDSLLDAALERWRKVVKQQALVTIIIHSNTIFAPVLPLLLGAPKYLSGEMSLGELMQIAAAFVQVQLAFNWLVENYIRLAEWSASSERVVNLWSTLKTLSGHPEESRVSIADSPDDAIHLRNLSVHQFGGRVVINDAEATFRQGEKVLIRGDSGSGKSTLIRAIAGLWPWGNGEVLIPKGARLRFIPQKPYIPNGTLRAALSYPDPPESMDTQPMLDALHRCGLRHVANRLDSEERWDKTLSGGEQQRLAFARLLLQKPEIVIMDEATSALDEASQDSMMSLFKQELAHTTLISIGHRPGLEDYHGRVVELVRHVKGAEMQDEAKKRTPKFLKRLLRKALPGSTDPQSGEPK